MSVFSTVSDIQALLPDTIKADLPSEVLEQQQPANYELICDRLATHYTMPPDATLSPRFYAVCQDIEAHLTAADIVEYGREAAADTDNMRWYAKTLRDWALDRMSMLSSGEMVASDGVASTVSIGYDGLSETDVDETTDDLYPFFRRAQTGPKAW